MPIYEYACKDCNHELEALQKMNDEPLKTCPECGKDSLNKQISAAGFRLKGSGWYETDFKNKQPSCATGASACQSCKA
jgi:putative FmdB family regulatory protein